MWDSGTLVTYIWRTFGLVVPKAFLGSFGALVSNLSVSGHKTKLKFGTDEHIWGSFDLVFKIFGGHSVHESTYRIR